MPYKFKAYRASDEILKIQIDSETEKTVRLFGFTEHKKTDWHQYFDTWDEAHAHLTRNAAEKTHAAQEVLHKAINRQEKISNMVAP